MRKLTTLSIFLLLALLLAACQPAVVPPAPSEPATAVPPVVEPAVTLAGTAWILSSLNGALPAADTTVTLVFGDEGVVSGSDGCNRFNTTYTQTGASLTFAQPMAGTMMACPEPAMTQAAAFATALASVTNYTASAQQLVLFSGTNIVATFVSEKQDLVGTTWDVVNVNNGQGALVGLVLDSEITLSFDSATELTGNAGCNQFFTSFTSDGKNITVQMPGSTRKFCPEPAGVMEQEAQFLAALQSAATYSVEGDMLEMRTAADEIALMAAPKVIVDLPAPDSTPSTPTGRVTGAAVLNIRSGPGTAFPVVAAARNGDEGTIVGRSEDSRWWAIAAPTLPGGIGWASVDFVIATNAENVPVIAAPPLPPTRVPAPTRVPPTAAPPTATAVPPTATPLPQAQINFWADRTTISQGECATLNWDVRNVQAVWVYPLGSDFNQFPRTGQGNERVCPVATTTYELRVLTADGATRFSQVTINVLVPAPTVAPTVAPPVAPTVAPPAVGNALSGTRWEVVNFNNGLGAVATLVPGSKVTLDFGTDGRASGRAGCNTFFSNYTVVGNTLSIARPGTTTLLCASPEGVMEQEQQFLAALGSAATFSIFGDSLEIRSNLDQIAIVAARVP